MTTTWKWKFPPTRTCLWDGSSLGESKELSLVRRGRIYVQLSVSALHRALSHARMGSLKILDCFFIGTAWIDNAEIIVLEINRFDPGRSNQKNLTETSPTSLMAGDIPVRTQIVLDCHPDAKYLTHNLTSLQDAIVELNKTLAHPHSNLDPSSFLSLRVHCTCSEEGVVVLECGCVMPSLAYCATPIRSIPIIQTALARNLSGPLPISALQGKYKHGFLTMDSSRKLILLLHSDPKVSSLPLIGVWVSGIETTQHPIVWAACTSYVHSGAFSDRVWGEVEKGTFLLLLYLKGSSQPHFMECMAGDRSVQVRDPITCSLSAAETKLQWMPDLKHIELELLPVDKSSALHTLMESVSGTAPNQRLYSHEIQSENIPPQPNMLMSYSSDRGPGHLSPSPAPERVIRDSNLSVISSLSTEDHSSTRCQNPGMSFLQDRGPTHSPSVSRMSECSSTSTHVSRTPLVDAATNTSVINKDCQRSSPSQEEKEGMALASRCLDALHDGRSMYSNVTSASVPETSYFSRETTAMHLDLRSYASTSSSSGDRSQTSRHCQDWVKEEEEEKADKSEERNRASFSHLLQENEAEYYKVLLNQVLGQKDISKDRNRSDVDSGNWHPPSHSVASRSLVSHGASSTGMNVDALEGAERGREVAGNSSYQYTDASINLNMTDLPPFSSTDGDMTMEANPSFTTSEPSNSLNYESLFCSGGSRNTSPVGASLLSVPPSGIHTMLLTAGLWGLDLSMDEDYHQADLIGKKYLQGMPSGAARDNRRRDPLPTHPAIDDSSVNQTLALSTTMYQFLERHNIMGRRKGPGPTPSRGVPNRKCSGPVPSYGVPDSMQGAGLLNRPHAGPTQPTPSQDCNILDVEKTRALKKYT